MSRLNVLVAPTLSSDLTNTLHAIGGGGDAEASQIPKSGAQLSAGQKLFNYGVRHLEDRPLSFIFGKEAVRLDLSVKAPVLGFYKASNMHASVGDEPWQQLPQTADDFQQGHGTYAFSAITPEAPRITGADVYSHYFDQLKNNRDKVVRWLELSDQPYINPNFWEMLFVEEQRLADIPCPVIPYDGRDLG